jgi:PAS domain S-box-containing protein
MNAATGHIAPSVRRIEVWEMPPSRQRWLVLVSTFCIYFAAVMIGSPLGSANFIGFDGIAILWLPQCALLMMLLVVAPRRWWGVMLAALAAHLTAQSLRAAPASTMVLQFLQGGILALSVATLSRAALGPARLAVSGIRHAAAHKPLSPRAISRRGKAPNRPERALLSNIYQCAPFGLVFLDTNLQIVEVNDFLSQSSGLPIERHIGRSLGDLFPPELAGAAEQLCRRTMQTGQPDINRKMAGGLAATPEQSRVWLASHCPVRDENGRILGVHLILQDITDHQRAEENLYRHQAALRENLHRMQSLANRVITVQEEERSRIARDLHDDVNQQLAALSMALSGLKRKMPHDPGIRRELQAARQLTVDLTEEVRNISHDLHSGVLQHAGLVPAIKVCCNELQRRTGIDIFFHPQEGIGEIPANISLCLYRLVQEAIANVVKHAHAKSIRVALVAKNHGVEMTVTDNGRGFDTSSPEAARGLGLISMDERVRLVRGRITIDSRPQQGTTVAAWVPRE